MATYYGINAGGNWSAGGTWSTTATKSAARTGGATQPTNADTCILDDYSGSVTIDTTTCVAKILDCTTNGNYAGTLTFTASQILGISTAGYITFASTMTLSGTGKLNMIGTCSLTSGGKTFPGALDFKTLGTKTLVDNWTVTGLFLSVGYGATQTINRTDATHGNMTLNGGMTIQSNILGTTTVVLGGGTWSGGGYVYNNLTFAGNVTLSGTVYYQTGILTYTSGTITTTNSTLNLSGNCTLTTDLGGGNKISFYKITATGNGTITLGSNLTADTFEAGGSPVFTGNFDMTVANLYIIIGNYASPMFQYPSGKTITVTSKLRIIYNQSYLTEGTIQSETPSSPFYLNYGGTKTDCFIGRMAFTDVDASGSAQILDNWYGGTLTRTTNIRNLTSANTQGVFGIM